MESGRKLRCAGHGEGGPLVEARGSGGRTDGGTGQLRVLGARRSASGEGGEDVDYEPTRPLPGRNRQNKRSRRTWQFRLALGIALADVVAQVRAVMG